MIGRNIRVLLADDHAVVRAGMRALLNGLEGIEVVGEASHGREVLAQFPTCRPDVVLMDISMPELNGLETTARLREQFPGARVLLLSMHAEAQYVSQALARGACGYLVKDADAVDVERGIRAVAQGDAYLSPSVARLLMEHRMTAGDASRLELLTGRQREILQLIVEGNGNKDIARKLDVSVKTVETHRANIMERLQIRDVPGLVRFAIREGLIAPE